MKVGFRGSLGERTNSQAELSQNCPQEKELIEAALRESGASVRADRAAANWLAGIYSGSKISRKDQKTASKLQVPAKPYLTTFLSQHRNTGWRSLANS